MYSIVVQMLTDFRLGCLMNITEMKWNDFKMSVDLHRSYLDLAINLNMFYYGITGAILSFHFTHLESNMAKYALVLPVLLSMGLAILFLFCVRLAHNLRLHIRSRAEELGIATYPEGIVLVAVCAIFGAVLLLVSAALSYYLITA